MDVARVASRSSQSGYASVDARNHFQRLGGADGETEQHTLEYYVSIPIDRLSTTTKAGRRLAGKLKDSAHTSK